MAKLTTPLVKLFFTHINTPDTAFNSGKYGTSAAFASKEDAQAFATAILEQVKLPTDAKPNWSKTERKSGVLRLHVGDWKLPMYKSPDGDYFIETSSKHPPRVYDLSGAPFLEEDVPNIVTGTKARLIVGLKAHKEYNSVSGYINGLQVISLPQAFDDASHLLGEGDTPFAQASQAAFDTFSEDGGGDTHAASAEAAGDVEEPAAIDDADF